jgi:ribosomal-protein-serine acetyltransferase
MRFFRRFQERWMFHYEIDQDTKLKLLELRHADEIHAILTHNVSHLQVELPWLHDQLTLSDATEYIQAGLDRFAVNNGLRAGIWYADQLAGIVSLHSVVWPDRKASLGYWLGESFQGKGLVTKSCRALVNYALSELKLHRLEIQCATENWRSRKVADRLGFTQEGILRQSWWTRDHFMDMVVYGLLVPDWKLTESKI